jgi:hypothetical protein
MCCGLWLGWDVPGARFSGTRKPWCHEHAPWQAPRGTTRSHSRQPLLPHKVPLAAAAAASQGPTGGSRCCASPHASAAALKAWLVVEQEPYAADIQAYFPTMVAAHTLHMHSHHVLRLPALPCVTPTRCRSCTFVSGGEALHCTWSYLCRRAHLGEHTCCTRCSPHAAVCTMGP